MKKTLFIKALDEGYVVTESNKQKAFASSTAIKEEIIDKELDKVLNQQYLQENSEVMICIEVHSNIPRNSESER